ncbi:hypothetical protein ACFO5R_08050 [Halosolutus amylolyticus]|uniref:Uncharacterized protein n=1 Tax=Halosolutus amylolyticus TaxID=2932267 RepID=A0ABD5PNI4_9EURY|nr:hypothetical protein [Halosolutus amylolyticus]
MSNQDQPPKTETESEPTRATRRTVLRGAGVAGLLTMGVGTASAQQYSTEQTQTQATKKPPHTRKTPKGIEKAKSKVPSFVKDKLDIKFPGTGGGGGDNGDGISG